MRRRAYCIVALVLIGVALRRCLTKGGDAARDQDDAKEAGAPCCSTDRFRPRGRYAYPAALLLAAIVLPCVSWWGVSGALRRAPDPTGLGALVMLLADPDVPVGIDVHYQEADGGDTVTLTWKTARQVPWRLVIPRVDDGGPRVTCGDGITVTNTRSGYVIGGRDVSSAPAQCRVSASSAVRRATRRETRIALIAVPVLLPLESVGLPLVSPDTPLRTEIDGQTFAWARQVTARATVVPRKGYDIVGASPGSYRVLGQRNVRWDLRTQVSEVPRLDLRSRVGEDHAQLALVGAGVLASLAVTCLAAAVRSLCRLRGCTEQQAAAYERRRAT